MLATLVLQPGKADSVRHRFRLHPLILVHLINDDKSFRVVYNALIFHSGHFAELFEEKASAWRCHLLRHNFASLGIVRVLAAHRLLPYDGNTAFIRRCRHLIRL